MSRRRKILLATLLISLISFNPGANENSMVVIDKLVPNNVRLSNANSEKAEYARVEKTVTSFLRKWSIAGASIAIAKEGKLVYAKGFGYADTALQIRHIYPEKTAYSRKTLLPEHVGDAA